MTDELKLYDLCAKITGKTDDPTSDLTKGTGGDTSS